MKKRFSVSLHGLFGQRTKRQQLQNRSGTGIFQCIQQKLLVRNRHFRSHQMPCRRCRSGGGQQDVIAKHIQIARKATRAIDRRGNNPDLRILGDQLWRDPIQNSLTRMTFADGSGAAGDIGQNGVPNGKSLGRRGDIRRMARQCIG